MGGKVVRAGLGYTIGNLAIKGISVISLPVFTRLMTTEEYGLYSTYVVYGNVLCLVAGLGLHTSLKNAKMEYGNEVDAYLSSIALLPILFSSILLILSPCFRGAVGDFPGFGGWIPLFMVLQALATGTVKLYNNRVSLDYAYKSYLGISLILSVGGVLMSLLLMLTVCGNSAFLGRVAGACIPAVAVSIYILCAFFKKARPAFNRGYFKFGLAYSLPLVPHGLSQTVLAQFGKIIIQRQVGNYAAGIYGFAYTMVAIPQTLMQSLNLAWSPWFYEAYAKKRIGPIKRRVNQYVSLFSAITIGLFCVSPEIVRVMSPEPYWDSMRIVCPALLGAYFTFMYCFPVDIEYFYKKTGYIATGTLAAAVVNVALCLWLVPVFGYEAAAYVTALTYFLYFAAHLVVAAIITRGRLPFDLKRMFTLVSIVVAMCFACRALVALPAYRYPASLVSMALIVRPYRNNLAKLLRDIKNDIA